MLFRWIPAVLLAIVLAACGKGPGAATAKGTAAPPAPLLIAPEDLPSGGPAEPSGPVKIRGQAIARRGPVLVLDREGTLYGCRRNDGRTWSKDRLGKETLVEGRLRGWDRDHGFYRVDALGGDL